MWSFAQYFVKTGKKPVDILCGSFIEQNMLNTNRKQMSSK